MSVINYVVYLGKCVAFLEILVAREEVNENTSPLRTLVKKMRNSRKRNALSLYRIVHGVSSCALRYLSRLVINSPP